MPTVVSICDLFVQKNRFLIIVVSGNTFYQIFVQSLVSMNRNAHGITFFAGITLWHHMVEVVGKQETNA